MEDLTGKTFGQYQIISPLGEGGMAAVYKAFQTSTQRFVALKILPSHFAKDPQFVSRFKQEAKLLAQLQHPHILSVFDFGQEEGFPFIVMPYVQGGTLKDSLVGFPLPWIKIRQIITQVGEALHYAHRQMLVHRDIKPSNILMDESGNCLLSDFGLAKIMESSIHLTNSGATLGTPAYMSPEQGMGEKISERSDIYSLGVVLYEMATGRIPFKAETPIAIIFKHIHDPLPMASTFNPNIPFELEQVINKSLAKTPEERYQSAKDMVQAVQHAIPEPGSPLHIGIPQERKPLPIYPAFSQEPEIELQKSLTNEATHMASPAPKTRRIKAILAVISMLIILGMMIFYRKAFHVNFQIGEAITNSPLHTLTIAPSSTEKMAIGITQTVLSTPNQSQPVEMVTLTANVSPSSTDSPLLLSDFLQLTNGIGNNLQPSFTPDGSKIVFISTRDGNQEIYLMNVDGSEQIRLTNSPDLSEDLPSFSPDGSLIIFSGFDGKSEDIFIMNLDGSLVRNITNTPNSNEGRPRFVRGQFVSLNVLFDSDRSGNWEIYFAPFETNQLGSMTQITHRPEFNDKFATYITATDQILFRSEAKGSNISHVYLINFDGTNLIELSDEFNDWYPRTSIDGQWIIFVSNRSRNEELYVMPLDGTNLIKITDHTAQDTTPTISPDNQWVVFASNRDDKNLQLYRTPFKP